MRVTLAGTAVALPGVGAESARYNLALAFLEAYASARLDGVALTRVEMPISLDEPNLPAGTAERLLASDPDVLGISSYCWDWDAWKDVLADVRKLSPATKIVLGGPTATFTARDILERSELVDVAVLGEGEETLVDLLRRELRDLDQVAGISWRDGDRVRDAAPRPPMDLATIPSPYVTGLLRPPRHNLMLECSRGCFFRCKYCAWKNFLGALRHVPDEILRRDIEWASDNHYGHAFILDSAVNFDSERLRSLGEVLRESGRRGGPRFSYFVSHEHFEDEQQSALEGVPTHELYVGLESIERGALRSIGRPPVDLAAFERRLDALSQIGPVIVSIILGIPGDTLAGFRRTVDYLARLAQGPRGRRISAVRVFWMIVPPGTFFWENRERFGIRTTARGAPYLVGCETFPSEDLAEAFRFLLGHPSRSLFLYDDASPVPHLPGLEGLAPRDGQRGGGPKRQGEGQRRGGGPPAYTLDQARALLGGIAPGAVLGGYGVVDLVVSEGHACLVLAKAERKVVVQVRPRTDEGPHFARTKTADLLWVARDEGGAGISTEEEAVVRSVADAIALRGA